MKHPWFNDDFGGDFVFEDVVEALTVYKSFHGTFENMDLDEFVVPDQSEAGLFDVNANINVNTDMNNNNDDDDGYNNDSLSLAGQESSTESNEAAQIDTEIARMEMEIQKGILPTSLEPTTEDLLMEELRITEEGQEVLSSQLATAITEAPSPNALEPQWPEHLVGMQLGSIVRRIQEGDLEVKHLPERKKVLDDIGFDWGDPKKFLDVPFDKAMCAMFAYYMIRGDLFVYEDFIMPDEDPWPKALAGFELGKVVFYLRSKQNFLEAYHPRKTYLLNMLEFVWFPMDALPLDPDAAELSWEHLHVKHVGHPLARVNAPPYSAVEHVHPVDHPEAKDRYEFDYELVRESPSPSLFLTYSFHSYSPVGSCSSSGGGSHYEEAPEFMDVVK